MMRRPPTSIELKLIDLIEYETFRTEQETARDQAKQKLSTGETSSAPSWNIGPKPKQEIYERIGYVPPQNRNTS